MRGIGFILLDDHSRFLVVDCQVAFPIAQLTVGLVPGESIHLLYAARELVATTGDDVELIVGQFAPALPYAAFPLRPVAGYSIPVHGVILGFMLPCRQRPAPVMSWERDVAIVIICPTAARRADAARRGASGTAP